jgi:hypothetical protein
MSEAVRAQGEPVRCAQGKPFDARALLWASRMTEEKAGQAKVGRYKTIPAEGREGFFE